MRRRLTIALVGVALASVLLVGAGVLVLAQIGARAQAVADARAQVDVLVDIAAFELAATDSRRRPGAQPLLQRLFPAVGFAEARLAIIERDGTVSTVEGFAVDGSQRSDRRLSPLTELDEAELATLAGGAAIVLDDDVLGAGPAFRGSRGDVVVLQAVAPDAPSTAFDGDGPMLAIVARQPVVTVGGRARLWFVVSAAAVLAGAAAVSVVLARRFSEPITDIERATAAVAAGDFTARVTVDGDDELAQLAGSVNRMASELERSKALDQQFLMSVSHDLRTPLTAIAGYGEALRDGAVDDPRTAGEVIGNQAARLERLVGDLLDLARLDANRFQLRIQEVDVAVVVGRTVAGLERRATAAGLSCRFDNHGPAPASVDPDRLGQAVGNLIDNAIKYASSTIAVRVSVDGDEAVVTVADDGPGISADDLPHVFERLYVAEHQPARAESSSGLGLAIVREIVTAMGGAVEASAGPPGSDPAAGTSRGTDRSGTVMTIRLPIHR